MSGAQKGKQTSDKTNPLMPGLRPRHDGWTRERTRVFLATLGKTGCIRDACRVAGASNTGAYRMRRRFPLFAAEWDKALARAHKGLQAIAWQRAVEGKETIIIRKGEEVERRISPDSAILGLLLKQGKMLGPVDRDKVITRDEYADGWRFDDNGKKYCHDFAEEARQTDAQRDAFFTQLRAMRRRLEEHAEAGGTCFTCGQVVPRDFPGNASHNELIMRGLIDPKALPGAD